MTSPSNVRVTGPLLPFSSGFIEFLAKSGYTPLSAANQVRVLAHLSRWMASEGVVVGQLTRQRSIDFLAARRQAGYTAWLSERGLAPLLSFLRSTGAVPEVASPVAVGPIEELLDAYRIYLLSERGLANASIGRRVPTARLFLTTWAGAERLPVQEMTTLHVREFVLHECTRRNVGVAQLLASDLRCLLRYLFIVGQVATNFSGL